MMPVDCSDKLDKFGLLEMLFLFLRYLSLDVDVFGSILTLRGRGEVGL